MDRVELRSGDARAEIAIRGAEAVRWQVGGRDLLWTGDPAHWAFSAPILFPLVGASVGGAIQVDGASYPMPQHGFARHAEFTLVEASGDRARLRLTDTAESREAYPFPFGLEVTATLGPSRLAIEAVVANSGTRPMPYALGFHPAFHWPFDAPDRAGHGVLFDAAEDPNVPEVAAGGLLSRTSRPVPLAGARLPLAPELFTEALLFLDAKSRGFGFTSPTGASIRMETEDLPHLAIWTKPTAPFVSLEAWTGHAEFEGGSGELADRASMRILPPGARGRHAMTAIWNPAAR